MRKSLAQNLYKLWATRQLNTVVFFTYHGLFIKRRVMQVGRTVCAPSFTQLRFAFSWLAYGLSPLSTRLITETTNLNNL